jgi:hypothetical protein
MAAVRDRPELAYPERPFHGRRRRLTSSAHEGPLSGRSRRSNVHVKAWANVRRWPGLSIAIATKAPTAFGHSAVSSIGLIRRLPARAEVSSRSCGRRQASIAPNLLSNDNQEPMTPPCSVGFRSFVSVSTGASAAFTFAYTVKLYTVNRTVQRPPSKDCSEEIPSGHACASDGIRISWRTALSKYRQKHRQKLAAATDRWRI